MVTARAPLRIAAVHMFVRFSVCLSVEKMRTQNAIFWKKTEQPETMVSDLMEILHELFKESVGPLRFKI